MNWPVFRLGELCERITDGSHNPPGGIESSEYMMLSSKNIFDDDINFDNPRFLTEDDFRLENRRTDVSVNDVLLTIVGTVGRVAVVTNLHPKFTLQRSVAVLKPVLDKVDSRFLMYTLRNMLDVLVAGARGVAQKGIYLKQIRDLEIPLPPLTEQKRIAAILDKADAIRRKRQQAIQLADDFLRAVFLDMFGDPVTNPKGWDVKRIEEIASKGKYAIKAGPFGSALKKEDYVPEGYKIYGQEQVIRDDLKYGDYFISEEKYESLASCSISEGDVLISLVGSFGKVSVVPKDYHPGIINPRLMKIKFDNSCANPWYMKYLLTTKEMIKKIEGMSHGGTMGILNVGKIRDLEIINPPLNLQENFLKISNQVRSIKARCELLAANPLFESLSQKAFSGQL